MPDLMPNLVLYDAETNRLAACGHGGSLYVCDYCRGRLPQFWYPKKQETGIERHWREQDELNAATTISNITGIGNID